MAGTIEPEQRARRRSRRLPRCGGLARRGLRRGDQPGSLGDPARDRARAAAVGVARRLDLPGERLDDDPVLVQPARLGEQLGPPSAPQLVDQRPEPRAGIRSHAGEHAERELDHRGGADHRIGGIAGEQPAIHLAQQHLGLRRLVGPGHESRTRHRVRVARGMHGAGQRPRWRVRGVDVARVPRSEPETSRPRTSPHTGCPGASPAELGHLGGRRLRTRWAPRPHRPGRRGRGYRGSRNT